MMTRQSFRQRRSPLFHPLGSRTVSRQLTRTIFGLLLLIGASTGRADEPIPCRERRFRIPFQIAPESVGDPGLSGVGLYLAVPGGPEGSTWRLVATESPYRSAFEFEASRDGLHSFAVRPLVGTPSATLPPQTTAEMRVLVDTAPPSLALSVTPLDTSRAVIRWRATDPNLAPETLSLRFGDRTVPTGNRTAGEVVVPVPSGPTPIVRGVVADLAGNRIESETGLPQTSAPSNRTESGPRIVAGPVSEGLPHSSMPVVRPATNRRVSEQPNQSANSSVTISPETHRHPSIHSVSNSQPVLMGPAPVTSSPDLRTVPAPAPKLPANAPVAEELRSVPPVLTPPNSRGLTAEPSAAISVSEPPPYRIDPPAPAPIVTEENGMTDFAQEPEPVGPQRRFVNGDVFELSYRVDQVGPSGIGAVDLFITEDNGAKWWRYGRDDDKQSPVSVRVPADGEYGFAIRIRSGVGLGDPVPRPRETPEMIVVVDRTPPRLRVHPIRADRSDALDRLPITWSMTDANPVQTAIRIEYTGDPGEAWETVTDWMPNTGRFDWQLGPHLPARVWLRISARDAAGNVTHVQTPQPIILDRSRPAGRLIDARAEEFSRGGNR